MTAEELLNQIAGNLLGIAICVVGIVLYSMNRPTGKPPKPPPAGKGRNGFSGSTQKCN